MVRIGYALSSEEHRPGELVRHARLAEEAGFSFALISDHFHPWIDAQGRVHRLNVQMSFGAAQLGTPMTMTMTEDLYDFGVKANIVPPPDSIVTDISS